MACNAYSVSFLIIVMIGFKSLYARYEYEHSQTIQSLILLISGYRNLDDFTFNYGLFFRKIKHKFYNLLFFENTHLPFYSITYIIHRIRCALIIPHLKIQPLKRFLLDNHPRYDLIIPHLKISTLKPRLINIIEQDTITNGFSV